MRVHVTHTALTLTQPLHVAREPCFDFFPSHPLLLLHHVIIGFLLPPCLLPLSSSYPLLQRRYHLVTLPSSFSCSFSAALQGMENCMVRKTVVIPITPLMQRGSSKVQNNWQVPPATGILSILICVFACVCSFDERRLLFLHSEVISLITALVLRTCSHIQFVSLCSDDMNVLTKACCWQKRIYQPSDLMKETPYFHSFSKAASNILSSWNLTAFFFC